MNLRFRLGNLALRQPRTHITPEKLATLRKIFDAVCDARAIPSDATLERNLLASRIMLMGQTVKSKMTFVALAKVATMRTIESGSNAPLSK